MTAARVPAIQGLPDPLQLFHIWILCREGGHKGPWGGPLGQAGSQRVLREHRRLIDVLHPDAKPGLALLGAGWGCLQWGLILHRHPELIVCTALVVQGLRKQSNRCSGLSKVQPCTSQTCKVCPEHCLPFPSPLTKQTLWDQAVKEQCRDNKMSLVMGCGELAVLLRCKLWSQLAGPVSL